MDATSNTMNKSKTRPNFNKDTTSVLIKWLADHTEHPWPTKQEKKELCRSSGLSPKQLRIWFTNNRKRKLASIAKEKSLRKRESTSFGSDDSDTKQSPSSYEREQEGTMRTSNSNSMQSSFFNESPCMQMNDLNAQIVGKMTEMSNY